jgi:DNA-binding XRE family transcriptional regulator
LASAAPSTKIVYCSRKARIFDEVNGFRLWYTFFMNEAAPSPTPAQSRAARGLLDWSQGELGTKSNLSESTIRDFEKGRRVPGPNNLAAIRSALETAGVEFINATGVRLVKRD